jgi:hypothetical protein
MSNYNVWGFGGVRFSYGGVTATFPYGKGQLSYSPEYGEIMNPSKKIFRKFYGLRANIEANIISAEDNMYAQIQALQTILNASLLANAGITIEPEYASTNNNNLSLTGMLYTGDYKLEDIVKREGIQGIVVKFYAQELVGSMPNLVNGETNSRVTSLGDVRVTSLGDIRITR